MQQPQQLQRRRAAAAPPWPVSSLLLLCALVLVSCVAVAAPADVPERMRTHSLMPPMLQRYWSNGMRFWAFGRHTIVTDRHVMLTEATREAKGYLWNRLRNNAQQFTLNVTLRLRDRGNAWFGDSGDGGIGIWYTSTHRVNYLSDATFFGFQTRFIGFGVVLDHYNRVTLVQSNNDTDMSVAVMRQRAQAKPTLSCAIPYLSTHPVTLSLVYADNVLNVYYAVYDAVDDDAVNDNNNDNNAGNDARTGGVPLWLADDALAPRTTVWCASLTQLQLSPSTSYHFGVTAANDKQSTVGHVLYRIVMSAMLPIVDADTLAGDAQATRRKPPRLLVRPKMKRASGGGGGGGSSPRNTHESTTQSAASTEAVLADDGTFSML